MASLNQTITLNTDLFPLGSAINKTFQKNTLITGNAQVFGTISLNPTAAPLLIEQIELNTINDRAVIFIQADASNGTDRILVGLQDTVTLTFDGLFELAAGEVALFPFKYDPNSIPANPLKLAATLKAAPTGTSARSLNFAILETA